MQLSAPAQWFTPVQRQEQVRQAWLAKVLMLCHGALAKFNFLKKIFNLKVCWFLYSDA